MPTDFFAPLSGTTQANSSSPTQLVPGLSRSHYYVVKALSTNPGNVRIGPAADLSAGGGMILEAATPPTKLDVQWNNGRLYIQSTVNGCSVTYHGTEDI